MLKKSIEFTDYNKLIPIIKRKMINQQNTKIMDEEIIDIKTNHRSYKIFSGLGKKHLYKFKMILSDIFSQYSWIDKDTLLIFNSEIIVNTQISMLRNFVRKYLKKEKAEIIFMVSINISDSFYDLKIFESGDYFDLVKHHEKITEISSQDITEEYYAKHAALSENNQKIYLNKNNFFEQQDASRGMGINIIDGLADMDFSIIPIYKKDTKEYSWKIVHARIENLENY